MLPKRAYTSRAFDATTDGSVVGSGSLPIFVLVKNVAVRTLTATCVTRRPSATTESVTAVASRTSCSSTAPGDVRS